jgi:hypothetical protein
MMEVLVKLANMRAPPLYGEASKQLSDRARNDRGIRVQPIFEQPRIQREEAQIGHANGAPSGKGR